MSRRDEKKPVLDYATPLTPVPRDGGAGLAAWIVCFYLAITCLGAFAFMQKEMAPAGSSIPRGPAVFMAASAATLTGMPSTYMFVPGSNGPTVLLVLTFAGALLSLIVGGMAIVRVLRLPYSDLSIVVWSLGACAIACVLGQFVMGPPLEGRTPADMEGPILGLSAFANSGVCLDTDRLPDLFSWRMHGLLLPLVLLGGMGIVVLMELVGAIKRRRPLSQHSRVVLTMSAGAYLLFFAAFFIVLSIQPSKSSHILTENVVTSSVAAINSRSAGFPIDYLGAFPRIMQWLLVLAMLVGGSSGGTAGGVKTTTLYELVRGVGRILRGQNVGKAFAIALVWLGVFAVIILGCFLTLLRMVPDVPSDRALVLAVSAVSNTGLSYDRVKVGTSAFYPIMAAGMLLGRLMPLAVLWWLASTTEDADVAVG